LTPAYHAVERHIAHQGAWAAFQQNPTLFYYLSPTDFNLGVFSIAGMCGGLVLFMTGSGNALLLALLWVLYMSIVNVGQSWYSFGWESQLLETGFLAIFSRPLWSFEQIPPANSESPLLLSVVCWGYQWLIFRIMLGAGLIKLRGDDCWRDLTCMHYHYETQPIPSPLSFFFHFNAPSWHMFETFANHIIEVLLPWFTFLPRPLRILNGVMQIGFQLTLIASGNLSFLNWLTLLPSIWLLDDAIWSALFPASTVARARENVVPNIEKEKASTGNLFPMSPRKLYTFIGICLACLLVRESVPVVLNLASSRQAMNTSFSPLKIVNTYGAFGSITRERNEVVLQATDAVNLSGKVEWYDLEFKCKPGDVNRAPCFISPYHLRIDWLAWFAGFQNYQHQPWLVSLAIKLIHADRQAFALLASQGNERWAGAPGRVGGETKRPVRFVRALHYEYKMQDTAASAGVLENCGSEKGACQLGEWQHGVWWRRRFLREYMPPIGLDNPSVVQFLRAHHMEDAAKQASSSSLSEGAARGPRDEL